MASFILSCALILSAVHQTTAGVVTNILRSSTSDIPRIFHIVGAGSNPPWLRGISDAWQQFFPEPVYSHHYWDVLGPESTNCFRKHFPAYLPLYIKQEITVRMASMRYCALFDSGGVSADSGLVVQPGFPHDLLLGGRVSMVNLPIAGTSQYGLFMASPRAHPLWRQLVPQVMQYFQQNTPLSCDGPDPCDLPDPCGEDPCDMPSPFVVAASVPCQGGGPCDQSVGHVVFSQVAPPCSGPDPCGDSTPVVVAANSCDADPCDDSDSSTSVHTVTSTVSGGTPSSTVHYTVGTSNGGTSSSSSSSSSGSAFQVLSFPMSSLLERVGAKSRMQFIDCSRTEYVVTSYCSSTGSSGTSQTVQEAHHYQASTGAAVASPAVAPSYYYYPPVHPYPFVAPPPAPYMPYPVPFSYGANGVALGTQHGHTIVVTHEMEAQRVRTIRPPAEDAGPARSVDWSADGSGLVVGYASGSVALFDGTTYLLQKLVRDQQCSAITAGVFWGTVGRQHVLTADELGRCHMLTYNTFLVTMTCEKKLLLKEDKPFRAMAPLRASKLAEAGLVAMVSSQALTVVGMAPTPRLVFKMPLSTSDALTVCWCTEPMPILCVGVGRTVHLLRPRSDLATFDVMAQVMLPSKDFASGFRALRCIGGGLLVGVVAPAQEPSSREVVLVQTNRARGSLLRGLGNVVYRHRLLGTYCSDLLAVTGRTAVLPGYQAGADTHHFTEVTVGCWQDEIEKLVKQHRLRNAITVESGVGSGALPQLADVDPPTPMELEALLRVYLSDMPKDDPKAAEAQVTVAVDACASMGMWDFLYRGVYVRCEACGEAVRDVYLKVVEKRLRSGVLPAGTVDSEVVAIVLSRFRDELTKHPTADLRRAAVDFCLSVKPDSLDLNFTTRMATEFGLWSVVVYIYNVAFGDYVTPMEVFTGAAMRTKKKLETRGPAALKALKSMPLVKDLYSYLTCTLAGKPYPLDTPTAMPSPPAAAVRELVKVIFDDQPGYFDKLVDISPEEFFKSLPATEECIRKCGARVEGREEQAAVMRSYYLFIARACQAEGIPIVPRGVRQQVLSVMLDSFPEKRVLVALERVFEDDRCATVNVEELVNEAAARGMPTVQAWALGHCLGKYEDMLQCYLDTPQLRDDVFDDILRTDDPSMQQGIRAAALKLVSKLIELNPAETGRLFLDGVLEVEDGSGPVVALGDIPDDLYCAFLLPLLNPDSTWQSSEGRKKFYRAHALTGLELLLRTDRQSGVAKFLLRTDQEAIPLDQARDLCQKYSSTQGLLCLFEKANNDDGVIDTILDALAKTDEEPRKLELISLAADFTLRRADKLQPEQISKLWMPCLALACDDQQISEMLIHKGGILDLVPVSQSIETLLRKRPGRRVDDDALRKPLVSLLSGIGFSHALAESTEDIARLDASRRFSGLVARQSRALSVNSVVCQTCQKALVGEDNPSGKVTVFDCGHTYHDRCCQPEPDEANPRPTLRECKLCRWG
ncbi:Vacuolar protein sorting-associated protein 8 [Perkinsus chesapeaki]|uniref:Vacuolar protein sorting-associated protein 8 n=1 Tax=Perkinsus chesapeaki TaxID=330153 RepID=A0A7J6MWC7_PERCH|nr:Vacuolar protein sorting-associated protein 8 [Perkinsus chesapeaki]